MNNMNNKVIIKNIFNNKIQYSNLDYVMMQYRENLYNKKFGYLEDGDFNVMDSVIINNERRYAYKHKESKIYVNEKDLAILCANKNIMSFCDSLLNKEDKDGN